MYTGSRSPAWHRDAIWCASLVLVAATSIGSAAFAWSRLAEEDASRSLLREVLRATLLPGADEDTRPLDVREGLAFTPGEPFEALPGSDVRIDPTEIGSFTGRAALDRVAGVWSDRLFEEGAEALRSSLGDELLGDQVDEAVAGPIRRLVEAELMEEMLGGGLDDGSRLADWRLQEERDPGEPVQPIVGMFVYAAPSDLRGLNERQIGEVALARLADLVVVEGAAEARGRITNVNLSARFEQALAQARTAVHELFSTMLMGRSGELTTRLEEARIRLDDHEAPPAGLELLLPAEERGRLAPDEVNERVLDALAVRAWQQGPAGLASVLEGDPRGERLAAAEGMVAAFSRPARDAARSVAWTAGVVALIAFVVVAVLATGVGRLVRPGTALLVGAAPAALAAWWLRGRLADDLPGSLPSGARVEGVFGELAGLGRYLASSVPTSAVDLVLRVHTVVAGIGLGLVVTALILLLVGLVRPRRRGYL